MTVLLFKYGLPAILGYTLFVGIAGRWNPVARPHYIEERPSWLLGLCVGAAVALVAGLVSYLAYGKDLPAVSQLLLPSASLLASLLVPACIGYFMYRRRIQKAHEIKPKASFDWVLHSGDLDSASAFDAELAKDHPLDIVLEETNAELDASLQRGEEVTPVFLQTAEVDTMVSDVMADAVNDDSQSTPDDEHQESFDLTMVHLNEEELQSIVADQQSVLSDNTAGDTEQMTVSLIRFEQERAQREEIEQELLSVKAKLRHLEQNMATQLHSESTALSALQDQLASSISECATLESQNSLEIEKRIALEQTVERLRQKILTAKQEIRRSTAARAKALSTANKSIAFARQTVQIRSRLESELSQARSTLKNRQTTVSSLIRALEKEKRRSEEDVLEKARELILHEKQMQSRRSLEDVARSVENKLTTRLVKKVAKARPLATGPDHLSGSSKLD